MKKSRIIFILFCFLLLNSNAQNNSEIGEETKMLIFISTETDGNRACKTTLEEWLSVKYNHLEFLTIENTPKFSLYKPLTISTIEREYWFQLFKIPDINSKNQSRYLLWYKDFDIEIWFRAAGYIVNDLNLLFNYLLRQKISENNLRKMLQEWGELDEMFLELDLDCIFNGYLSGNTDSACFRAVYYININDSCVGFKPLSEIELNSTFSRTPLSGSKSKLYRKF